MNHRCQNGCHRPQCGGYNPLGLCCSCLQEYRDRIGSPLRAGAGEPERPIPMRRCPECGFGRCVLVKVNSKVDASGTTIAWKPPDEGCPFLRGERPQSGASAQTAAKSVAPTSAEGSRNLLAALASPRATPTRRPR